MAQSRSPKKASRVLGNDPFVRGASPRAPPQPIVAAAPAPSKRAAPRVRGNKAGAPSTRRGPPAAAKPKATPRPSQTGASPASVAGAAMAALRSLAAHPARPAEVDELGANPQLIQRFAGVIDFLFDHYWRVTVKGADLLPEGPALVICNHSGALPFDGPIVRAALERGPPGRQAHGLVPGRQARWLVEDALFYAPFVGTLLNRLGAVRACPENATRLLEKGHAVAVFPEGLAGISKSYRHRYRLQRFGRGGFVKLALRMRAPLVPAALVGAEEAMPLLATLPARRLGLPFLPVTPTFPLLGPLGLVPLPTKWSVIFGEPLDLSAYGPESAQDLSLVQRLTEEVRERIRAQIQDALDARRSAFRG